MNQLSSLYCPMCEFEGDSYNDLRVHVQVHHRKSELVRAYLDSMPGVHESR